MKKIHPLDVTPILGSAPCSPTLLKTKSIANGSTFTAVPFAPVTKIPSGRVVSSITTSFSASSSRQPVVLVITRMKQIKSTCKGSFIFFTLFDVYMITSRKFQ